MAEKQMNAYEGMFLISQAEAADLAGAVEHINSLFERAGAELIAMQKWDDRRLSYEIDKQKRGVYLLTYFRAEPGRLQSFERDCNLSERLMRVMVLKADHLTEEEMRSTDARDELQVEAKLRAERAAERERAGAAGSMTLGAPKAPEPEQPAEEASAPEASGEAPAPAEAGTEG